MATSEPQADLQNLPPGVSGAVKASTEVVKRKSKRHEYVEVDGFHFRRKRRTPATPLASAAAANAAATAAAAVGSVGEAACKQSPAAIRHSLQLENAAQPTPAQATVPAAASHDDEDAAMADGTAAGADADRAPAQPASCSHPSSTDARFGASALSMPAETGTSDTAVAAAAAAAAEAAAEAAAAAAAADAAAAAAAAAQAAAADLEMQEATEEPAEAENPQQSGPLQFTMLPSELCHLVGTFLAAELHKLPGCSPAAAQQAADGIRQQLVERLQHSQLADGDEAGASVQAAGQEAPASSSTPPQAVPLLTVLPHQVEELKAKLVDKHNKLMQEQEAWLQLLAQYNDMASAAPPASAAAAASPDSSPSTHQQQQPTDRQTPSLEAAGVEAGPATGACYGGPEGGADGPVSAQQQESLLGVELKVEVLTALVSKMEHLVARAEATARTLQATYRAEKFSVFPHVDSPAMLIRSLAGESTQGADGNQD